MASNDIERWVHWAGWAGQHALGLFVLALALVLAGTGAFWWAVLRYAGPASDTRLPPLLALALRVATGFLVILAGAALFAELAEGLDAQEEIGHADEAFTRAVAASVSPVVVQVFAALTVLGDPLTLSTLCIGMAIALWLAGRRWLAMAWTLTVTGGGALNMLLKLVFARIRPVHDGVVAAEGFSFPSGHSSGAVVTYGMLAYLAMRLLPARWHVPAAMALAALAATVGASRMFLRVHYPSDVLAGFALGAVWVAVCVVSVEVTRWVRKGRRGDAPQRAGGS
jgi:membrane-associated phospholipid phosphatase